MKAFDFLTPQPVFIEIGQSTLKVLKGDNGLELPLERQLNGRLTSSCQETVISSLQRFLQQKSWRPGRRALCAIGSRGVSLRRLALPAASTDEFQRLLALQIEAEFPLPPDELAWGYGELNGENLPPSRTTTSQEVIVVAVKREVLEEYSEMLSRCGLSPVFTLAALARNSICREPPRTYTILDIGRSHSELTLFENAVPTGLRIIPWGSENLTRSIQRQLEINRDDAEKLKLELDQNPALDAELGQKIQSAVGNELDSVAGVISSQPTGQKIYLSGRTAHLPKIAASLAAVLKGGVECETIQGPSGQGRSAAILGLQKSFERNGTGAPLIIHLNRRKGVQTVARPAHWKWAAAACLLGVTSFSLRYAEAFIQKPRLLQRLAEIRTYQQGMPGIDKELSFLQYLQTNQPPYLEATVAIANAAAPGTRIESLSMNRRGDLSLRGVLQNPQQAVEFRSKLADSGFFSTVVLEEQSPAPDRQRVTVRMSAQWKPAGARPSVATDSSSSKNLKASTTAAVVKTNVVAVTNAVPIPAAQSGGLK